MKKLFLTICLIVSFLVINQVSFAASPTIISPNSGEVWKQYENHVISWSGGVDTVPTLELIDENGKAVGLIIGSSNIPAGTVTWNARSVDTDRTVNSKTIAVISGKYKVRITDSTGVDESDNFFTILTQAKAGPSVVIFSPEGGETFQKGSEISVRWETNNWTFLPQTPIKIFIRWESACSKEIVTVPIFSSQYSWKIPNNVFPGNDYQIMISHPAGGDPYPVPKDYFPTSVSRGVFTIAGATPPSPSLTLTSPRENEVWRQGESHRIEWRSNNISEDIDLNIVLVVDPDKGELAQQKIIATVKADREFYDWNITENLSGVPYAIELVADIPTNFIGGKCYEIGGTGKSVIKSRQVLFTQQIATPTGEITSTPSPETKASDRTFFNFFRKIFITPIKWFFGLFSR